MARPKQIGLSYFPMDTGIFSDRKIRKLLKTFGAPGYLVYNFVLCEIYKDKGYFVECNEDFLFDIADTLNLNEVTVKDIIRFCSQNLLFDNSIYQDSNVLTSSGIQKRYLEVKSRSEVEILEKYRIIATPKRNRATINTINEQETPVSAAEIPQKKSKLNKNKEEDPLKRSGTFIGCEKDLSCGVDSKNKKNGAPPKNGNSEDKKEDFREKVFQYRDQYPESLLYDFFDYWTEMSREGRSMRFENEKTWELPKRLARWSKNTHPSKQTVSTVTFAEKVYQSNQRSKEIINQIYNENHSK